MAIITLKCKQCGGNIVLDNSREIGTCENCYTQFIVKQDQIIQNITQHVTKYVYGYKGKDAEELLMDGYKFIHFGDGKKANAKFREAIELEPDCWSAWLGYASTGGDRSKYLSIVDAYRHTYNVAKGEKQEVDTFVSMTRCFSDKHLRAAFIRAFNIASDKERCNIFDLVSGVIGCDDSEIASLAVDLCPEDWRAHFAMAKFRQIRARWCEWEGGFFTGRYLPDHVTEVLDIFVKAYRLAKNEGSEAEKTVLSYIDTMARDDSYRIFYNELITRIRRV